MTRSSIFIHPRALVETTDIGPGTRILSQHAPHAGRTRGPGLQHLRRHVCGKRIGFKTTYVGPEYTLGANFTFLFGFTIGAWARSAAWTVVMHPVKPTSSISADRTAPSPMSAPARSNSPSKTGGPLAQHAVGPMT